MKISRGVQKKAQRIVVYGPEGIGKSTFLSHFPDVVFVDTEGSTGQLDVARFDDMTSKQKVVQAIRAVANGEVECQTLAIDTWDWFEKMCIKALLEKTGNHSIEDFGYGKGYIRLAEDEREVLAELDKVIDRGINVAIGAHAQMRKFEQPDEMGAYDRWELKLEKKTAPLLKEWADCLLFANYKTIVVEDPNTKSKKAQGGKRVMYTSHNACWDAKNRYGMKECVPFSYDQIASYIPSDKPRRAEEPKAKEEPPKDRAIDRLKKLIEETDGIEPLDVQVFLNSKVSRKTGRKILGDDELIDDLSDDYIEKSILAKWPSFSKAVKESAIKMEVPFE